ILELRNLMKLLRNLKIGKEDSESKYNCSFSFHEKARIRFGNRNRLDMSCQYRYNKTLVPFFQQNKKQQTDAEKKDWQLSWMAANMLRENFMMKKEKKNYKH